MAVFGWGLRVLVMVRVRVGAGSSGMICQMVVVHCIAGVLAEVCDRVTVTAGGRNTGVGGVVVAAIDGNMGGNAALR